MWLVATVSHEGWLYNECFMLLAADPRMMHVSPSQAKMGIVGQEEIRNRNWTGTEVQNKRRSFDEQNDA